MRHKYNAKPSWRGEHRFDSKAEAEFYDRLRLYEKAGEVAMVLFQVPFRLPGGVTYRADFMVFYSDGDVEVIEVKGAETEAWKVKKRLVESLYPVKVSVVRKTKSGWEGWDR